MVSNCFRMRTFNAGGNHEIVLPNGKVVLVDPYFPDGAGLTREDVTGADYIILTHCHYDHDGELGYFVRKFGAKVFCGALSAEEVMKYHRIPYNNLFPVFPNSKFTADDLTFEFFQAKHNLMNYAWSPDEDRSKTRGVEGHRALDMFGSMESLDWMLTTSNGFRVMMCSGRTVFEDAFERCRALRPNVLLRQAGFRTDKNPAEQVSPAELAALLARYRAQIVFPFHTEILEARRGKEWVRTYMEQVRREMERLDPAAAFIYPEPYRWYSIGIEVACE